MTLHPFRRRRASSRSGGRSGCHRCRLECSTPPGLACSADLERLGILLGRQLQADEPQRSPIHRPCLGEEGIALLSQLLRAGPSNICGIVKCRAEASFRVCLSPVAVAPPKLRLSSSAPVNGPPVEKKIAKKRGRRDSTAPGCSPCRRLKKRHSRGGFHGLARLTLTKLILSGTPNHAIQSSRDRKVCMNAVGGATAGAPPTGGELVYSIDDGGGANESSTYSCALAPVPRSEPRPLPRPLLPWEGRPTRQLDATWREKCTQVLPAATASSSPSGRHGGLLSGPGGQPGVRFQHHRVPAAVASGLFVSGLQSDAGGGRGRRI